uniref:Protein MIX23 n=1 Tax=Trichobilharzia regenti TaxID=157069 RepID=A0AA85IS98_TRIRE|nr:unnamed protein product [Trichobilharzia regenti]
MNPGLPCDDFLQSAKLLNLWRKSDDRVRYELNAQIPTVSFQNKVDCSTKCSEFIEKMLTDHEGRSKAIKDCIRYSTDKLHSLNSSYSENSDDMNKKQITREIKKKQLLLRQFQSELLEEEVIQTAALKVIYERCREHLRHPIFEKFK